LEAPTRLSCHAGGRGFVPVARVLRAACGLQAATCRTDDGRVRPELALVGFFGASMRSVLGLVVASLVAAAAWIGAWAAVRGTCSAEAETEHCVKSHREVQYRGRLFDRGGRSLPATFDLSSDAFRGFDQGRVPFRTDRRGRFCFWWIREERAPAIELTSGSSTGVLRLGPETTLGLDGGTVVEGRWRPHADSAAECQRASSGVPWWQFADVDENPRLVALQVLPIVGLLLVALGVLLPLPTRLATAAWVAGATFSSRTSCS
jgi:hypothetical protein